MLQADSIKIKDYITFKEAEFPLSAYPLSVVRGRNMDRKGPKSANAVGKSALFSAIPVLRYSAAPTSVRKNSAKDMHRNGSEITLNFQNHGKRYQIKQFQKGQSVRYQIIKGNKPQDYRQIKDAMSEIARLIPISQEQFYSFVYIDGRNQSVLQRGTVAERFAFFQKVFELDVYDKIAKKINTEYNALKFDAQRLKELETEYAEKQSAMPKKSVEELRERRDTLYEKARKVRKKVDKFLADLRHISTYLTLAEGLDLSLPLDTIKKSLQEALDDEKALRKQLKEAVAYQAAYEQHKKSVERRTEIKAELEKIEGDVKLLPTLREKFQEAVNKIDQLQDKLKAQEDDAAKLNKLRKRLAEFNFKKSETEAYGSLTADSLRKQLARCEETIEARSTAITMLHGHDDPHCPTCAQSLPNKRRDKVIEGFEIDITKAKKKRSLLERFLDAVAMTQEAKQLETVLDSRKEMQLKYTKLVDKAKKYNKQIKRLEHKRDLLNELKNLPASSFEKKRLMDKPESIEKLLDMHSTRIEELRNTVSRREKLAEMKVQFESYQEAQDRYQKLQAYIDHYQPLLQKAQDTLQNMTVKVTKAETLAQDLKDLRKQIKKRKDASADFAIYEALREAYGAKGLRQMRVAYLASQFQANLNQLAPMLFGEDISFKIVIGNSKFDILATRNGLTGDVRMLSGFESRAFTLLTMLALLPFIPASSRCNFLILDEIESGLDEASMRIIANFIPTLAEVVPNVIIVTPQSEKTFFIPNAVNWVVEKRNKVSRLIKGN